MFKLIASLAAAGTTAIFCLLLLPASLLAQGTQLSAHVYVPSSTDSSLGQSSVVIADADCTLTAPSGCTVSGTDGAYRGTLLATSSGSLTATRNLIAPLSPGRAYYVKNSTTGGQLLCVKGATGAAACIPNGQVGTVVSDGTNYNLGSASSLGGESVTLADADYTLSATDALYSFISFSGSLTATRSIFAPAALGETFTITNTTAQTLWFHTSTAGTGVFILSGQTMTVSYNGTGYAQPAVNNPFLASFNLASCSTLYIFPVGISGTTANNQCASQASSNRNGTIIGSPIVSQYGLILNANGARSQAVQLPTSENAWKTIVVAGYFPNWGNALGISWGDTFSFPSNGALLGGTNANLTTTVPWNPAQQPGKVADGLFVFRPTGHVNAMTKPIPLGWHVVVMVCDTGGGTAQDYVDGVAYPMMASNVTTCPTNTSTGNQQIGGTSLLTDTWKTMALVGSETYYTALSPTQIYKESQAWLDYMKRNIIQPQTEQYSPANSPPVVMMCCDSRTVGSAAPPGPSAYMALDDTSAVIKVSASSGTALYDICSANSVPDANSSLSDLSNPLAAKVAIIVWAGVNDFIHGNYVTNNGAAYYSCVARQLRKLNPNAALFLSTEIDACNPSDITQKNATNPYVLNQALAWGYNGGIINLNSAQRLGADNACANTTYFQAASPHPTDFANQTIIAPIDSNTINEAWGSTTQNFNVRDSSSGTTYTELAKDGALRLTGGLAQTITLPDCQGYSHVRTIWNDSSVQSTLLPGVTGMGGTFTQYINGQTSIPLPPNSTTEVEPVPGPSSTGTCTYRLKAQAQTTFASGTIANGGSPFMPVYTGTNSIGPSSNVIDNGTTFQVSGENTALVTASGVPSFSLSNGVGWSLSGNGYLGATGIANSGTNFSGYPVNWQSSYWNGSAPATDSYTLTASPDSGTNPTTHLVIGHSGSSGAASVDVQNANLTVSGSSVCRQDGTNCPSGIGGQDYWWNQGIGCTMGTTAGDTCTGSIQVPTNTLPDGNYFLQCTAYQVGGVIDVMPIPGPPWVTTAGASITMDAAVTSSTAGGSWTPQVTCHIHHN